MLQDLVCCFVTHVLLCTTMVPSVFQLLKYDQYTSHQRPGQSHGAPRSASKLAAESAAPEVFS